MIETISAPFMWLDQHAGAVIAVATVIYMATTIRLFLEARAARRATEAATIQDREFRIRETAPSIVPESAMIKLGAQPVFKISIQPVGKAASDVTLDARFCPSDRSVAWEDGKEITPSGVASWPTVAVTMHSSYALGPEIGSGTPLLRFMWSTEFGERLGRTARYDLKRDPEPPHKFSFTFATPGPIELMHLKSKRNGG